MPFNEINGKQIRSGVLEDRHIKGKLSESVLNIQWTNASHAADILRNKPILDYIQLGATVPMLTGHTEHTINLSLDTSDVQLPGVLLDKEIRFRSDVGDPLISATNGLEVVAKITAKIGPGGSGGFDYTLSFFENDGVTPYSFPVDANITVMYPVRTTLWDAAENFAANERFVDGAVDIRTRLDIEQLARDLFGDGYTFNADGAQTLTKTLAEQLLEATHGDTEDTDGISATDIINEVFTARSSYESLAARLNAGDQNLTDAISTLVNNLASVAAGKGASLIGVQDSADLFLAATVEAVLQEIGLEIKAARGSKATLDARLDVSLRDDGKLQENAKIHKHDSHAFKPGSDVTAVVFANLGLIKLTATTIKENIDQLDVYINGSLQAEGFHYTLPRSGGFITGVDFTPEVIGADDVVILKWAIYNE